MSEKGFFLELLIVNDRSVKVVLNFDIAVGMNVKAIAESVYSLCQKRD